MLVDTAGIRRRRRSRATSSTTPQLRSERAAERADVAIVVCDASEGVTSEDLRIAELAMKERLRDARRRSTSGTSSRRGDLDDAKARRSSSELRLRPPVIT